MTERPDLRTAIENQRKQRAETTERRPDPVGDQFAEKHLGALDQAVDLAAADPAYVAGLRPEERHAITMRAANRANRKDNGK